MNLCLVALMFVTASTSVFAQPTPIAQRTLASDQEFDSGSRIQISALTDIQVGNLVTLARVWGFLKYHHPAVTAGKRNWDYDLFRVLPSVLAAPDRAHTNDAILNWIDELGSVPACSPCVPAPTGDLDLKPPLEWIHDQSALGALLSERLEQIYAHRTGHQFYVSQAWQTGNPQFDHEPAYPEIVYPDFRYQLLALFRWWNILQYWAPDRNVADQDWPAVLKSLIPKVALARDKQAYQLAIFEMIPATNDTHAGLEGALAKRPPVGNCAVPVSLRFIDGKPVVYRTSGDNTGLQPGDVLEKLDGVPIPSLVADWSRFYAVSNGAALERDFAIILTRGICGSISLDVRRNGHSQRVLTARIQYDPVLTHDQPGDTFRLLSPDIAYIKLSSIKTGDLPAYFEKAKATKGLVVDIRNYPSEFMPFALGAYFAVRPTSFVVFTECDLSNPGAFHFIAGPLIEPGPVHYGGKVVILVDETTQSQAEYTAMALRAMPHALVVGSTTAGADGNVSLIPLPGGLKTMISGLGVFYPNHWPTQRAGIIPDVTVRPTVQGVAAGRDEVLETAVHFIETGIDPNKTRPATDQSSK
ncbi:MAG: S41 family peptidase [Terracidiphilus sp.]